MDQLIEFTFDALGVDPEEHPLIITEQPFAPRLQRERLLQILFETYNVPMMYPGLHPVCALFASGRTSGLVVDSGEGVTHCVPIYQGEMLSHAVIRTPIAGYDISQCLAKQLGKSYR